MISWFWTSEFDLIMRCFLPLNVYSRNKMRRVRKGPAPIIQHRWICENSEALQRTLIFEPIVLPGFVYRPFSLNTYNFICVWVQGNERERYLALASGRLGGCLLRSKSLYFQMLWGRYQDARFPDVGVQRALSTAVFRKLATEEDGAPERRTGPDADHWGKQDDLGFRINCYYFIEPCWIECFLMRRKMN